MERKLILLELNEVPYRVIEAYCRERPQSTLARLLPRCAQFQTLTEDRLALDPWISWPTLHRGVTDETHQILHLGQVDEAIDRRLPPIWRMLKERGLQVGVFGSLHSSCVPPDAHEYSFYVPDYFDSKVFAHPHTLRPFQELNLLMTRQSARNVTRKLPLGAFARFMATAPTAGLTWSTMTDSAIHLASEAVDRSLRIRRRALQPLVMADLFLRQMHRTKPHFATFYTNHVAAAMHRYWGAAFPEDYDRPLDRDWIGKYSGEIRFAMDKFDTILERVVRFVQVNSEYTLLIASSMGQAAIPAEKTFEFLTITDLERFMSAGLGVPAGGWASRPAMVPVRCVVVQEPYREGALAAIRSLAVGGVAIKEDKRPTAPLSYDERERGFFQLFVQFDGYQGADTALLNGKSVRLAEVGLGLMAHEDGVNCTAQHVPAGSLLVFRRSGVTQNGAVRQTISSVDVVPSIMRFFGFEKPAHLRGTASVSLAV